MKKRVSTRNWFPKGETERHLPGQTIKERLRILLNSNRSTNSHPTKTSSSPSFPDPESPSSSFIVPSSKKKKPYTLLKFKGEDEKKIKLNTLLNKFRRDISKYQESSLHEYEADPFGVREIDDFVSAFSEARTLPRAAKTIQSTFRMHKTRRIFNRYVSKQRSLRERLFIMWRNEFRARKLFRNQTLSHTFRCWNKYVRVKVTKAYRKEREEKSRELNKREYELKKYMPSANFSSEGEEEEEEEENLKEEEKDDNLLSLSELEKRRRHHNKRRRMRRIVKMRRMTELFCRWKSTTNLIKFRRARAISKLRAWCNDVTNGKMGRWTSEWKFVAFQLWYRYTVFMKCIRNSMTVPDFNVIKGYLFEWTRFVKSYERQKTLDHDTSVMSKMVTQRRYFRRLRLYLNVRRLKARKVIMAIRNDENACLRRTLHAWHLVSSSRGKKFRNLRRVLLAWRDVAYFEKYVSLSLGFCFLFVSTVHLSCKNLSFLSINVHTHTYIHTYIQVQQSKHV